MSEFVNSKAGLSVKLDSCVRFCPVLCRLCVGNEGETVRGVQYLEFKQ